MDLVLDNIIFSLQKSGGISVYWSELIKEFYLTRYNYDKFTFIEDLSNSKNNIFRQELEIKDDVLKNSPVNFISRIRPVSINSVSTNRFIFHSSYYRISNSDSAINVTTIHDFIQEKLYSKFYNLNIHMKRRAIKKSKAIITISNNTKEDLLYYYPTLKEENISVIYNGVSDEFVFRNYDLSICYEKKYILFIGSRVYYKNFDFAIDVLSKLPDYSLYIVGQELTSAEKSNLTLKLGSRYKLFKNVSISLLNELYNCALLLIYPSNYEGFGIPVIEAMRCGCPVVANNIPSIKEISQDACFLVEKLCIDDYISVIKSIEINRNQLQEIGFEVSSQFTWRKTADETHNLYLKTLNNKI